jgi:hypothetical protein
VIRELCDGLHLHCCMDCARHVDNLLSPPGMYDRFIRPAATADGKCPQWKAPPVRPVQAPEETL